MTSTSLSSIDIDFLSLSLKAMYSSGLLSNSCLALNLPILAASLTSLTVGAVKNTVVYPGISVINKN